MSTHGHIPVSRHSLKAPDTGHIRCHRITRLWPAFLNARPLRGCARDAAENSFTGMGIGASMTGMRVVIEGMTMGFLLLAFNQISNQAGMLHYTSGGQYKVQCLCPHEYVCKGKVFCIKDA